MTLSIEAIPVKKMVLLKESKKGNLPNLIIIGAQKCATSSLHYYLGLHPEIFMSREKELNFFIRERNWSRGTEWYKSNFRGKGKIFGEASPGYTTYPFLLGVPERMYSVVPMVKLIYILRNPIDRIISHYLHNYTGGWENRKIEDALSHFDSTPYVCLSKYYTQLEQYLNYFPISNILIITMEDLYAHRRVTLQKVFSFLDVDETFYSSKFHHIKHKSIEKRQKNRIGVLLKRLSETKMAKIFSTDVRMNIGRILYLPFSSEIKTPVLDESLKAELIDYLKDDVSRLRQCTGNNFESWGV